MSRKSFCQLTTPSNSSPKVRDKRAIMKRMISTSTWYLFGMAQRQVRWWKQAPLRSQLSLRVFFRRPKTLSWRCYSPEGWSEVKSCREAVCSCLVTRSSVRNKMKSLKFSKMSTIMSNSYSTRMRKFIFWNGCCLRNGISCRASKTDQNFQSSEMSSSHNCRQAHIGVGLTPFRIRHSHRFQIKFRLLIRKNRLSRRLGDLAS